MKIKVKNLIGPALDWAVAKCEGESYVSQSGTNDINIEYEATNYSTNWRQGGPIIERANITIIRANDEYISKKYIPNWFAECDRWVGHNLHTSYEGEYMDPTFMIDEQGGQYGPTPLIAAMRAYVTSKLGDEVDVQDDLNE